MIKISPKEIERLHSRKTKLQQEIQDVDRQLRAVAILQGKDEIPSSAGQPGKPGETMLAAIERLVGESPNGIKGKDLRAKLRAHGHAVGNYYYTAVQRLKNKKIIKSKGGVLVKTT